MNVQSCACTCASREEPPSARRRHLLGVVHLAASPVFHKPSCWAFPGRGCAIRPANTRITFRRTKVRHRPRHELRRLTWQLRVFPSFTTDLQYADVLLPVAEWHLERRSSELHSSASFCFGASRSLSATKNTSRSLWLDDNSEPIAAMTTSMFYLD